MILPEPAPLPPHESYRKKLLYTALIAAAIGTAIVALLLVYEDKKISTPSTTHMDRSAASTTTSSSEQSKKATTTQEGTTTTSRGHITPSTVDLTHLPLGDGNYSTSAKKGYVYSCMTSFNGGGAFTQGPWIDATNNTWDLTQKAQVDGSVSWPNASWNISTNGQTRTLTGNDLPRNHTTGTYPISSSDDAYSYDRNPNSIAAHTISLTLPTTPTFLDAPQCVGGEVGMMLSGVLIFNAFDAGGRDAVAMEVQDHCQGHPQEGSYYHYHGWSSCLEDKTEATQHSALVGYAFDGFGIFGLKGDGGNELTSEDLDECHGHTHEVSWDGQTKSIYHYHMTQDFPYSVGCFRGKPVVKALSSAGGQQSGHQPGQGGPPKGFPPPRR